MLAQVAGRRWTIEESFQTGKELAGLDEHQVRRWTSWHRWTVLAMLAHAFLAVTAAHEHARAAPPQGLIPLTRNETRRLPSSTRLVEEDGVLVASGETVIDDDDVFGLTDSGRT